MAKSKKKISKTKLFLAIYLGNEASMKKWEKLSAKVRREREIAGMKAWGEWVVRNQRSIVDTGAPLGSTLWIDRKGIKKTTNELAAYTVVRANSHAAAAKLFENHPHFTLFPGLAVEVMECLDLPT